MAKCSNELGDIWPDDVYVVVGPNARIKPDDQSVTMSEFKGWKTRMTRGGSQQFLGDPATGNTYFDYTSITGEFTLSQKATLGEEMIFMAYKPAETFSGGVINIIPIEYFYDLIANTPIPNPTGITEGGQVVYIVIKPNGFSYTWGSSFEFSDTMPEQPFAIAPGTEQVYEFTFITSLNLFVCTGQSLNVAV